MVAPHQKLLRTATIAFVIVGIWLADAEVLHCCRLVEKTGPPAAHAFIVRIGEIKQNCTHLEEPKKQTNEKFC